MQHKDARLQSCISRPRSTSHTRSMPFQYAPETRQHKVNLQQILYMVAWAVAGSYSISVGASSSTANLTQRKRLRVVQEEAGRPTQSWQLAVQDDKNTSKSSVKEYTLGSTKAQDLGRNSGVVENENVFEPPGWTCWGLDNQNDQQWSSDMHPRPSRAPNW